MLIPASGFFTLCIAIFLLYSVFSLPFRWIRYWLYNQRNIVREEHGLPPIFPQPKNTIRYGERMRLIAEHDKRMKNL
jgi:hypothetical protein